MSESSVKTFTGLSGVTYVGEALDLGHGVVLRSTYAHLFAANMMAFARAPKASCTRHRGAPRGAGSATMSKSSWRFPARARSREVSAVKMPSG